MTTSTDRALRYEHAAEVLRQHAQDATDGPWEVTDCEGELELRAATTLPQFDPTGGYRLPASYSPEHMVAEHSLDTWDPGEDDQDDELRANVAWAALVDPRIAEPLASLLTNCAYYSGEIAESWHDAATALADVVLDVEDREKAWKAAS